MIYELIAEKQIYISSNIQLSSKFSRIRNFSFSNTLIPAKFIGYIASCVPYSRYAI